MAARQFIVVDDAPGNRDSLSPAFHAEAYDIVTCEKGAKAVRQPSGSAPELRVFRIAGKQATRGSTLFELCVVVAIIGLLTSLAVQNFAKAREVSQSTICAENLEMIHAAKIAWAIETDAGNGRRALKEDLLPFFGDNDFPECPDGGTYTIGKVKDPPTCSAGHTLQ